MSDHSYHLSSYLKSNPIWLVIAGMAFVLMLTFVTVQLLGLGGIGGRPTTLSDCVAAGKDRDTYCRASGRAEGSGPSRGDCILQLTAGRGRFFATSRPEVVSEHYDNLSGPRAAQSLQAKRQGGLTTEFRGKIACSKSNGQNCTARARIAAKAYPVSCAPHRAALRLY